MFQLSKNNKIEFLGKIFPKILAFESETISWDILYISSGKYRQHSEEIQSGNVSLFSSGIQLRPEIKIIHKEFKKFYWSTLKFHKTKTEKFSSFQVIPVE